MESHAGLLAHTTFGLVEGFGTAGDSLLAGALLDYASLDGNADFRGLLGTLRVSSAQGSSTSELDRLGRFEEEALSANQDSNVSEAFSNSFQNLPLFESTGLALTLLDNASSSTIFNRGADVDLLTGSSENSLLVGRFGSDSLTGSRFSENQTIASLPDLTGGFSKVKLPEPIAPDAKGQVRLTVTNQGDQRATGPLKISLFASTDSILDGND